MSSVCSTASFLSALLNPTTISSLLISRLKYPQLMKNGGYTSYTHIFHANTNIGSKDLCALFESLHYLYNTLSYLNIQIQIKRVEKEL